MRDLKLLAEAHPAIKRDEAGRASCYRLPRGEGPRVTFGERVALHVGQQVMSFLEGTLLPGWLGELAEKLDDFDVPGASATASRLVPRLTFVSEPSRSYGARDEVIATLFKALLEDRVVTVDYARDGTLELHPYALAIYRRALYLLAWNPSDHRKQTLAVDRMATCVLGTGTFRRREEHDPARDVDGYFGIWREPAPERVVLRFHPDKRALLEARHWHGTARLEPAADGRVDLVMHAGGRELVSFALEWGKACEVIEPAWLRDEVQAELRGALAGYVAAGQEREDQ